MISVHSTSKYELSYDVLDCRQVDLTNRAEPIPQVHQTVVVTKEIYVFIISTIYTD